MFKSRSIFLMLVLFAFVGVLTLSIHSQANAASSTKVKAIDNDFDKCLDAKYSLGKNFELKYVEFVAGRIYQFKSSVIGCSDKKEIKLKDVTWYINGKKLAVSKKFKIPEKYANKKIKVVVRYYDELGVLKKWTLKQYLKYPKYTVPANENVKQMTMKNVITQGNLSFTVKSKGFVDGSKPNVSKVLSVNVKPKTSIDLFMSGKTVDGQRDVFQVGYLKNVLNVKGAKIKYQWFSCSQDKLTVIGIVSIVQFEECVKWVKIPNATSAKYQVTNDYAGKHIGVLWTVTKKGYISSSGWINSLEE